MAHWSSVHVCRFAAGTANKADPHVSHESVLAEEQLKVANKTVEDQKIELRELRGELRDTQDELEGKCDEISQLQGKVVNIRSHALKLEDELRTMSGGEASNVHRTAELQKELRSQKAAAGMECLSFCSATSLTCAIGSA